MGMGKRMSRSADIGLLVTIIPLGGVDRCGQRERPGTNRVFSAKVSGHLGCELETWQF